MKLEHCYVNLVDLPEVLPFTVKEGKDFGNSDEKILEFVEAVEEFDNVHYIGQDNVEGKFYQRFLFENGGFMEIMQKAPSAIVAHFSKEERAEKFSEVLKDVITSKCEGKAAELLKDDVKVEKEREGRLNYEKWSKLNKVRESILED